jgi:hypothetical protein
LVGQQAGGGTEGAQEVSPEDAVEQAAQRAAERAVPLADQQAENIAQYIAENHAQLYASLSEIMSDANFSGLVPAHLIETAAQQLGVSTEDARSTLGYVARQFQAQAVRYIQDQGIDYASLQNWLKSDHGADKETRELLSKAMREHSQDRSLEGYDLVISRFLATLAREHPESLLQQLEGVANIRKDPSTGAVLVDIPDMGTTSFEVAARNGWLKTRRGGQQPRDGRAGTRSRTSTLA